MVNLNFLASCHIFLLLTYRIRHVSQSTQNITLSKQRLLSDTSDVLPTYVIYGDNHITEKYSQFLMLAIDDR